MSAPPRVFARIVPDDDQTEGFIAELLRQSLRRARSQTARHGRDTGSGAGRSDVGCFVLILGRFASFRTPRVSVASFLSLRGRGRTGRGKSRLLRRRPHSSKPLEAHRKATSSDAYTAEGAHFEWIRLHVVLCNAQRWPLSCEGTSRSSGSSEARRVYMERRASTPRAWPCVCRRDSRLPDTDRSAASLGHWSPSCRRRC